MKVKLDHDYPQYEAFSEDAASNSLTPASSASSASNVVNRRNSLMRSRAMEGAGAGYATAYGAYGGHGKGGCKCKCDKGGEAEDNMAFGLAAAAAIAAAIIQIISAGRRKRRRREAVSEEEEEELWVEGVQDLVFKGRKTKMIFLPFVCLCTLSIASFSSSLHSLGVISGAFFPP